MNSWAKLVLLLAAVGLLLGGGVIWNRNHSRPPVRVVVQLRVQPPEQLDLVIAKANSARFKYLLGKISSTRPYLAQQLRLKRLPGSDHLEASIRLENREEARRYLEAFTTALQDFCGSEVQLSLEGQKIR